MKKIYFRSVPFVKEDVTLAIESGADMILTDAANLSKAAALSRIPVADDALMNTITLSSKSDETEAAELLAAGKTVALKKGWEIIPVENLLAQGGSGSLALYADNRDEARLAAGILEKGADIIIVTAACELKAILDEVKFSAPPLALSEAVIKEITPVGLGHRVCVDTLSNLKTGSGMLVGNSSDFTFLVHAETERNEYVASRPFRVNAGAVHSYAVTPHDKTAYLEEIKAGREVLIVEWNGHASIAVAGRVKVEKRPMLHITAESEGKAGGIFLQNAETIRLVKPDGTPVSVVNLKLGDAVLCRLDVAGRHFGMRVSEDIKEK
jgi:3-dehydroquinate synthase II